MPDVMTKDGAYIMSDGVGKISPALAQQCTQALVAAGRWTQGVAPASAFQIRCGGAKGMVVVDSTIKGTKCVCIRTIGHDQ